MTFSDTDLTHAFCFNCLISSDVDNFLLTFNPPKTKYFLFYQKDPRE